MRECVARIARGEGLAEDDARAFGAFLAAKEAAGHRFLGALAGDDAPLDTVTGRCGLPPVRTFSVANGEPARLRACPTPPSPTKPPSDS